MEQYSTCWLYASVEINLRMAEGHGDELDTNANPTHLATTDTALLTVADPDITDVRQAKLLNNLVDACDLLRVGNALG